MNLNSNIKTLKPHVFAFIPKVELKMIYGQAFPRAQVASEATFHTAVSGAAINNSAKIFRLNFLRASQTSDLFTKHRKTA